MWWNRGFYLCFFDLRFYVKQKRIATKKYVFTGCFYLLNRSMGNAFLKPCNHAWGGQASWLKDRKERTGFNIKTMGSTWNRHFLDVEIFRYVSVLSNDP